MAETNNAVIENGLRQISLSGRVAKGFNCTVKAIVKGKAKIVFLADDCDNKDFKALITGLCKKYDVKLQSVPQKQVLGKALGLTTLRHDGTVRRQINCGACAIIKYGSVITAEVEEFRNAFDPAPVEAAE
ncbi:ribosomal protein L7Ae [Tritrichomonas foetus]|uniref:Ribosomal protein L7Ae n=1 Tax=Tritrichomonas foetus TaxID=1144522 RepID=A0A1J4K194_9EUKA|nr:ribosomal protein L7Ae [Tritrichomonas foetus]|eukprot:OHT05201.1 ribosomal protein L7Ae [Tritrichomonas foetus]